MTGKYMLTLKDTEIVAQSNNLRSLMDLQKSASTDFEGRLGWEIVDTTTGEVIDYGKSGLKTTLHDLAEWGELSIRLYNILAKATGVITGKTPDNILNTVTMRDIREMVLGGKFVGLPGMGTKTRKEFYDLLIKYCGNTRITRLAINENIDLHSSTAENDLTGKGEELDKEYFADLSDGYYKRYGF